MDINVDAALVEHALKRFPGKSNVDAVNACLEAYFSISTGKENIKENLDKLKSDVKTSMQLLDKVLASLQQS